MNRTRSVLLPICGCACLTQAGLNRKTTLATATAKLAVGATDLDVLGKLIRELKVEIFGFVVLFTIVVFTHSTLAAVTRCARELVTRVAGFSDGMESSVPVRLADDLVVRVVSLPALLVLKLFAWLDRKQEKRDAPDIYTLLKEYGDAGNEDRLYGEALNILEAEKATTLWLPLTLRRG